MASLLLPHGSGANLRTVVTMLVQHEQSSKLSRLSSATHRAAKTPERIHPGDAFEVVVMFTDDARVELCMCRRRDDVLRDTLEPEALVVMAVHRSWWPTAEKALSRKLRRKGHHVILVNTEQNK
jgi:hypothetical protein